MVVPRFGVQVGGLLYRTAGRVLGHPPWRLHGAHSSRDEDTGRVTGLPLAAPLSSFELTWRSGSVPALTAASTTTIRSRIASGQSRPIGSRGKNCWSARMAVGATILPRC